MEINSSFQSWVLFVLENQEMYKGVFCLRPLDAILLANTLYGEVFENPKFLQNMDRKLIREQRTLSRRVQGSANWHKQRMKVARIHERIANARTDYLQKITTHILKNHDIIAIEDLQVSNVRKSHQLAKAIGEVSFLPS